MIVQGPWQGSHVEGDFSSDLAELMKRHKVQAFAFVVIRKLDPIDAEYRHKMGELDDSSVAHCVMATLVRQCAREVENRILGGKE